MFSQMLIIGAAIAGSTSLFAVNSASVDSVNRQSTTLQAQTNTIAPDTATAGSDLPPTEDVMSADITYTLGQFAEGGVVFWLDPSQQHGLVAAIVDQDGGNGVPWHNGSDLLIGAYGNGVYLGALNNTTIIAVQGAGTYAATVCSSYSGGGYTDWYLPSQIELALMYMARSTIDTTSVANGGAGFVSAPYWSSFECTDGSVWLQNFSTGEHFTPPKATLQRVRAVRAF